MAADLVESARAADAVVIGAGQAGLAVSHQLTELAVPHVVLERSRIAETWHGRWDSFTLVTPNWSIRLPGISVPGQPDGFLTKAETIAMLESYAATSGSPVFGGVAVDRLEPGANAELALQTSAGAFGTKAVTVCTGSFRTPHRPFESQFPPDVRVMDATEYRSPHDLDPGRVVLVGSGQTGCQLAEELQRAGREVVLSCGRSPWLPRRLDGVDIFVWLDRVSFFDQPLEALPSPMARLLANPMLTGRDGGRDLNLRTLQALGVRLAGRLLSASGSELTFADDLVASVNFGDERYADVRLLLSKKLPALGVDVPEMPVPPQFRSDGITSLPCAGTSTVIYTAGYRPDYSSWIDFPVFDDLGFPITRDGATAVDGLWFCGAHFLRNRKSGILLGVGEDATIVAGSVARYLRSGRTG